MVVGTKSRMHLALSPVCVNRIQTEIYNTSWPPSMSTGPSHDDHQIQLCIFYVSRSCQQDPDTENQVLQLNPTGGPPVDANRGYQEKHVSR